MEIRNRKVIITGAASGVGKELTKKFLSYNSIVVAVDVNAENLKELKKELNTDKLYTYQLDVTDRAAIKKFKKWYAKELRNLDILINNAGIIQPFMKVEDLPDEITDRVMKVNFRGPYDLIQDFMDLLKQKHETYIVNVSSMGGFFPFPYQTVYGASKAALKIFTEGLYAELSSSNVHVMIVLPGAMATNITQNSGVEMTQTSSDTSSSIPMLSASDAADQIITGIVKNKFKIFVGKDAKFMRLLYKWNSKKAIDFINKKMAGLGK